MSYDFARERDEASLCAELDDLRYEAEQDVLDDERTDLRRAYRCRDRMCGALDCSNCYPGGDGEPPTQEELDDVADLERNEEQYTDSLFQFGDALRELLDQFRA